MDECNSIVSDRRAQASRATKLLRPVFNSQARDSIKIRLFRATVETILFYGLEAVPMTETRERTLDGTHSFGMLSASTFRRLCLPEL